MEENEIFVETETNEPEGTMDIVDVNTDNSESGLLAGLITLGLAGLGGFVVGKFGKPFVTKVKKTASRIKRAWKDSKEEPEEEQVKAETKVEDQPDKKSYTYKKK